ncbi:protein RNA-directed DNA methylation 3-like [Hyposmocoma kahamanoa]|uniref:protein RNA-directed DNA methylation 3-like n=1 Tax=Hyposmocoma kahamanoa TaxID=1477025 RepID=UPI000E6D9CBF|nr:protein RNA-directed DNA methylation 3-like [Hyposmocoma kahamanoa]
MLSSTKVVLFFGVVLVTLALVAENEVSAFDASCNSKPSPPEPCNDGKNWDNGKKGNNWGEKCDDDMKGKKDNWGEKCDDDKKGKKGNWGDKCDDDKKGKKDNWGE